MKPQTVMVNIIAKKNNTFHSYVQPQILNTETTITESDENLGHERRLNIPKGNQQS